MLLKTLSFQNTFELLQNSNFFYLVKLDMQGNYVYLNNHFVNSNSTYYDHETVKPASTALHPDDYAGSYAVFQECVASPNQCISCNLRKLDGKGGYIITAWEYKANQLPNGEIDGVIGVGYDITSFESHKEYINYLTGTLNDLAFKQSHLLRRPLANLLGLIEVLSQQSHQEEDLTDIVDMLRKSCTELNDEFELFLLRNLPQDNTQKN